MHQGRHHHVIMAYRCTRLFKFAMNEDFRVAFWGRNGLAKTKLGMDEDLTLTLQAHKSEMWPLFKEAKVTGKCAFWRITELFIDNTQICLPSSV